MSKTTKEKKYPARLLVTRDEEDGDTFFTAHTDVASIELDVGVRESVAVYELVEQKTIVNETRFIEQE